MPVRLVSYADAAFRSSLERLIASAARAGITDARAWTREALEQTWLYAVHRSVLDERRGGGYWLWKPFIIKEALEDLAPGDVLVYADAGLEIAAALDPIVEICAARADILLFAGHYDDLGAPGPNLCGKWTKRDCFVCLDCDDADYHAGQMVDASLILLRRTPRAVAFVREWLLHCSQRQLLTDDPNVCGLPDLPEFIEHRHDQSLLSLLARRDGVELFRHPSQYGNHLKLEAFRVAGEWARYPYGAKGLYENSPYGTLVNHHRGALGLRGLRVQVQGVVPAARTRVFEAWTRPEVLLKWTPAGRRVLSAEADVRIGGEYRLALTLAAGDGSAPIGGTYLEVDPPERLVYSWPWESTVTVEFHDEGEGTRVALTHGPFPTELIREYHAIGWRAFLDTLACEVVRA